MHLQRSRASWVSPSGYAATHCRQCEAGWTRTGKEGGVLTICLLDREPVLADMISCDRYEPKPGGPPPPEPPEAMHTA